MPPERSWVFREADDRLQILPVAGARRQPGYDTLIHVKRAAGNPKDLEAIAELEAIREERGRGDEAR